MNRGAEFRGKSELAARLTTAGAGRHERLLAAAIDRAAEAPLAAREPKVEPSTSRRERFDRPDWRRLVEVEWPHEQGHRQSQWHASLADWEEHWQNQWHPRTRVERSAPPCISGTCPSCRQIPRALAVRRRS